MLLPSCSVAILALFAGCAPQVLSSPLNGKIGDLSLPSPVPTTSNAHFQRRGAPDVAHNFLPALLPRAWKRQDLNTTTTTTTTTSTTSSTTSSGSDAAATPVPVVVAGGAVVPVAAGATVVGGVGGGTFIVNGVSTPIAEGETKIAGEETANPDPSPSPTPSTTTSSSSSPTPTPADSGTPAPYIIIPVKDTPADQLLAFTVTLQETIKAIGVSNLTDATLGFRFWTADLTLSQAEEVSKNPIVATAVSDTATLSPDPLLKTTSSTARRDNKNPSNPFTSLQERDGEIIRQSNASIETCVFSQPKTQPMDYVQNFAYDSQAGVGVTIYIFESGANLEHPEFKYMPGTKRWLFTTPDQSQDDPDGHGSCVLSKAVGVTYGIAKRSDIVMVKYRELDNTNAFVSSIIQGLYQVKDDVIANKLTGKAVVNMSLGTSFTNQDLIDEWRVALQSLIDIDVILVTASGNDRSYRENVRDYPALFGETLPILVVGAVDALGNRASFSQGTTELTISAPGLIFGEDGMPCAGKTGDEVLTAQGTSLSAPSVAGLAAYYLSLDQYRTQLQVPGKVAQNVKDLLVSTAWARPGSKEGLLVAWNGQESDVSDCESSKTRKGRRQAACQPSDLGTQPCPTIPISQTSEMPTINCDGGSLQAAHEGSFYAVFSTCSANMTIKFEYDDGTREWVDVQAGYQGSTAVLKSCNWTAYTD